jgi:hypothetical protein
LTITDIGIRWINAGSEDTSIAKISKIHGAFRQDGNDVRASIDVAGEVLKFIASACRYRRAMLRWLRHAL